MGVQVMDSISERKREIEKMSLNNSDSLSGRSFLRALALGSAVICLQLGLDVFHGTAVTGGQVALAQTATQDPRPKRMVPPMSSETYDRLAKFYEIMSPTDKDGNPIPLEEVGERDLPAAQKILDNLLTRYRRLNGNEMAQVHRNYSWLAQEMDDVPLAIEHLTKILDYSESITYALEEMALENVSKLKFTLEDYEGALDYALRHMELSISEGPTDYVYVSQIYFAMEDYENVKTWIKLAIRIQEEHEREVKEFWYEILLASVSVLEQWDEVLDVSKICAINYGELKYWIHMAQAYMQLEDEESALYTLECAHTAGLLDREKEYTNFASMLAMGEAAIRSTIILEEGLELEIIEPDSKVYKWLAQYYEISQEHDLAIENYILAAKDSKEGGKLWMRLAALYNEIGKFDECVEAADTALDLGELTQPNRAWLTKGVCQFSAEDYAGAKTTFTDLRLELLRSDAESDKALLNTARAYLRSIENEFRIQKYEEDVTAAELAYAEEKRKRS